MSETTISVEASVARQLGGDIMVLKSVAHTGIQKLHQDPPAAFPDKVSLGESLRDAARLHGVDWSLVSEYLSELGINFQNRHIFLR